MVTADIVECGQVASPYFVLCAVHILGQGNVRHVTRPPRRPCEAHSTLIEHLVALLGIASAAAGHQIFPMHRPAMPFRHDVVYCQIAGLYSAVLASVVVACKNRSA